MKQAFCALVISCAVQTCFAQIDRGVTTNEQQSQNWSSFIPNLFGNPYDTPVREVSLKIDALAQAELAKGVTIADLKQKSELFERELTLAATQIPAGNNEATVREYFNAALNYVTSLNRWLTALIRSSVASEQLENPSAFTSECTRYRDPMNAGTCMMNASFKMQKALNEVELASAAYTTAKTKKHEAMLSFAEARNKVNGVVSKKSLAVMSSFDQLLAKK